jgi:FO synthase
MVDSCSPRSRSPQSRSPQSRALSRALRRAHEGLSPDLTEATALLCARGEELDDLLRSASRVRDAGLAAVGRSGIVTYSPKVFVPLTRLCRDRCHYCTFATTPGKLHATGHGPFLTPDEVRNIAVAGAAAGCTEALFTLGDRPERRWPTARSWLEERGYGDTLAYVRAMAILVLEETGLLPHLNPGVLSWEEMRRLKPVAPSMGMMLETTATRLWSTPGGPHFGSPDKEPALRLRVLADAGRSSIPFTTGILVGIGETPRERAETLFAIRAIAAEFGGIQEVIVQGFRAKPDTAMRSVGDATPDEVVSTVAVARMVLGPTMRIQAPPNLCDATELGRLLNAGVDDWGGVSPVTPDHINPERPWPSVESLARRCADAGFELRERLTVYPELMRRGAPWVDSRLRNYVAALADPATGLAVADRRPSGLPWQESDSWSAEGRVALHREVDTVGRSGDRRGDFDEVYGSWSAVPAGPSVTRTTRGSPSGDAAAALRLAERDPAGLLKPKHVGATLELLTARGAALDAVCSLADSVRRDAVGDDVTYVVNRNINFTNVCYVGCRFCAFAQRKSDADAFTLSLAQVGDRAAEAVATGATEVCVQGGIHPDLPGSSYAAIAREIRRRAPAVHLHAFSPMEIANGAARTGVSHEEFLRSLREAGVASIPGTAAEILDDEIRWVLTKGKLPTATWVDIVSTAHRVGLPSSATMMYGHVDHPSHWIAHLRVIATIQDETGGFTEFVPLPFVHTNAPLYLAGKARPGPTLEDNRAVHAVARLALHGRIANIQCSWVKLGAEGARQMLLGGANDLGGTLMEETISRMAGSQHGSSRSVAQLKEMTAAVGRPARQRTTIYNFIDD